MKKGCKKKKMCCILLLLNCLNEEDSTHETIEHNNYNNRTLYYIILCFYSLSLLLYCIIIKFYQKTGSVVQQTPETDGETPLQQTAVVRVQGLVQRDGRRRRSRLRGYGRVPHELSLQLLSVLGMHQLVDGLVHDVGLQNHTR